MSKLTDSFTFKTLLLGDGAVGKTALAHRFVHEKFKNTYLMTIGMEPYTRYQTINKANVCFSIWDIAGQERFKIMRGMFYRGSLAALVVFDLTRETSLEHVHKWIIESRKEAPDVLYILVGNKSDLVNDRAVPKRDAEKIAKEFDCISYIETSALTGKNVNEAFVSIGESVLNSYYSK